MKTTKVPCRPHIRQWMLTEFGQEPIEATQRNFLGGLIRNASIGTYPESREISVPGSAVLLIAMSNPLAAVSSTNVTRELGYLLEEHFSLAVISFVRGFVNAGKTSYQAIISFYEHYSISPDDYDMEAVRKIWRDHEGTSQQAKKKAAKKAKV